MMSGRNGGRSPVVAALLLAVVASGCGGGAGEITGVVRLGGRPLTSGSVTFIDARGETFGDAIAPDGSYRVTGLAPGTARIGVRSHPRVPPGLSGQREADDGSPRSPARYEQPARSGLTWDVRPGR